MVLLLAVDDLDMAVGKVLAAADVHIMIAGAEQQQIVEGNVAAVADDVAPDPVL